MGDNYDPYKKKPLLKNHSYGNINVLRDSGEILMNQRNKSTFYRNRDFSNNSTISRINSSSNNDSIIPNGHLKTISNGQLNTRCYNANDEEENFIEDSLNLTKPASIIENKRLGYIGNESVRKQNSSIKNPLGINIKVKNNESNVCGSNNIDINNLNMNELEMFLNKKKIEMPDKYNDNYINFIKNYRAFTLCGNKDGISNNILYNQKEKIINNRINKESNIFRQSSNKNNNQYNNHILNRNSADIENGIFNKMVFNANYLSGGSKRNNDSINKNNIYPN